MSDANGAQKRNYVITTNEPSADTLGAVAALRRAAIKAECEAIAMLGSFPAWQDGKVVYLTEVQYTEEEIREAYAFGRTAGTPPPGALLKCKPAATATVEEAITEPERGAVASSD